MVRIIISAAVVVFVFFMLLWRTRFAGRGKFFDNYFSVGQTHSIKGLCAVFILLSHLCSYFADAFPSLFLFKYVGAIMVAGFFFVSGYGLQYGMMNKDNYLKGFFSKRMLSLALPYYIINFFYIVTNHMDLKCIIQSLFGYHLWFMMAIAIFYAGFYLCGRIFGKKRLCAAMTVFTLIYIAVMYKLGFGLWWYCSSLAFAAGMWICQYKEKFTVFFSKKWALKMLLLAALFAATFAYYCRCLHEETLLTLVISVINTTVFAAALAVLSIKVQLKNPILHFCGGLSLELYLTHALWISWAGYALDVFAPSIPYRDAVYLVSVIVGTVVMSVIVHVVSGVLLKAVRGFGGKKAKNAAKM